MDERDYLRHLLATLAYRGGKCLKGAPDTFAAYEGGGRTPLAILSHVGDLFDWALSMAQGQKKWQVATPVSWDLEAARFHAALAALDRHFATEPIQAEWPRLVQGPLADALTHVGQLAMLRRMAGAPIPGENYFVADIQPGRVGPDQAPPRRPF
jgi:hypothetical protein